MQDQRLSGVMFALVNPLPMSRRPYGTPLAESWSILSPLRALVEGRWGGLERRLDGRE